MFIVPIGLYKITASAENLETVSFAYVETYELKTSEKLSTDDAYINAERCGHVSPVSDFIDADGRYSVAYSDSNNVYITRYKPDMTVSDTITIKKQYPLVGGVICDNTGYYYIAWGQNDDKGNGGIPTVAISKHEHNGAHIKTTEYITNTHDTGAWEEYLTYKGKWATRYPFHSGNCSMTIQNGVLICFIGREMYSGHQSSAVYSVNINDLSKNYDYFTYSSHSFNQRVIPLSSGGVLFCDHGDAYPRAFKLSKSKDEEYESFHFVDQPSGKCNNDTYAELGGICEFDTGYVLVGSSVKGSDRGGNKQLFFQLVNKELSRTISSGNNRTVKAGGNNVTDTGVVWLTDYKEASARNINICRINSGSLLVIWEKYESGNFSQSYYTMLDSKGTVINPVSVLGTRVNGSEELKYNDGYVYWATANDSESIFIHRMKLDSNVMIQYKTVHTYKGKPIKPTFSISLDGKTLNKDSDYSLVYKNADVIGETSVKVIGKNKYVNWQCNVTYNISFAKPKLKGRKISNKKIELYWDALSCPYHKEAIVIGSSKSNSLSYTYRSHSHPTEYEVYISTNGGAYEMLSYIEGDKTSCTISKLDLNNNTYRFKIRAKINGDRFDYNWNLRKWITSEIYSDFSNILRA